MSEIYANTKKQPLDQHLFAVGVVAKEIMKIFRVDKQLQKAALMAGFWHDIGKLEVHFQSWLNAELKKKNPNMDLPENGVHIEGGKGFSNFSWEKYPTHNEVSVLIYELLAESSLGKIEEKSIKHSIYWHHAKPIRKDEISSLTQILARLRDNELNILLSQSRSIMESVDVLANNYFDEKYIKMKKVSNHKEEIDDIKLPKYKTYEIGESIDFYQGQIKKNAKENLIRTAVITADRLISSLECIDLKNYIDNKKLENFIEKQLIINRGLNQHIKACLDGFETKYPNSDRNNQQKQTAKNLADKEINIAVLNGPAGCGKTKVALEWALNIGAKQIIWVCPRVAICQGLYNDLKGDDYLPNAIIEIYTGEFKHTNKHKTFDEKDSFKLNTKEHFKGDIVLTTIDQIISAITTHKDISTLTKFMNATVVFDEFHEYIPMAGFNILFAELSECKKMQQNEEAFPNTLLVSATPNYYFVKEFLDIRNSDIKSIESFNDKTYQIEFVDYDESLEDESNPLYSSADKNTFVISNTATTAQKSFIGNQERENGLLTHSKLTPNDREEIFNKVIDSFKENGRHRFDVLRSGPVIQAALNISCKDMISEMSVAENILQRLGRLNRFAEFDTATLKIALTESIKTGKQTGKLARFLARNFQWQSTKVWTRFLQNKLNDNQTVVISDLYKWYQEFYGNENCIKMIKQDFIDSLKKSVGVIEKNIFEPKRIKLSKTSTIKLKKHSLRGNSRFVQMAIYDVQNKKVLDEYLNESITLGVNEIKNYGDDESPLVFMGKKHHNIKKDDNKKYGVTKTTKFKTKLYLEKSRDPETPIYVSYTPQDLEIVNATEETAIYYLRGIREVIGVMALSKLQKD